MKPREIFDTAYNEDSLVRNTENGKVFIVKGRCKDGTYACINADSREVDLITPSTSYELIEEEVSKYYTPSFDSTYFFLSYDVDKGEMYVNMGAYRPYLKKCRNHVKQGNCFRERIHAEEVLKKGLNAGVYA